MIVGVDPGVSGAISLLDPVSRDVRTWPLPILRVSVGKRQRSRLDHERLDVLLRGLSCYPVTLAVLEDIWARPGQHASSLFWQGFMCGAIEQALVATGWPLRKVPPNVWKKALGVKASKDDARLAASRMFPAAANQWSKKSQDGLAEATLIAAWGLRSCRESHPATADNPPLALHQ